MAGIEAGPVLFRTQLSGRGLAAARVGWLLVVVPTLALSVFGFVAGFADLTLLGPESIFVALDQASIDPALSVVVALVLPLVLMTAIGAVMFWKRPADPMALLMSMMLITLTVAVSRSTFAAMSTVSELDWIVRGVFFVGFGSLVLVFALFPNGRSVPALAWMSAPVLATILAALPDLPKVLATFPSRPPDIDEGAWTLNMTVLIAVFIFVVICQVYRYRTVSTKNERLQAKWVILPLGLLVAQVFLIFVLSPVFERSDAWAGWAQLSVAPAALMLPVGVAAAILRYRLYEIERIISRTVEYVLVVGLLGAVFFGVVTAASSLLPTESDLAIAVSTLAAAGLFNPVRKRVQVWVDRRFNRSRYDAQRVMDRFAGSLRDRVDSEEVVDGWVGVVSDTMQPASVGVWVREA